MPHVADQRADELAIRRFDEDQRDPRDLPLEPRTQLLASFGVLGHMDRRDVVGHRPSERQRMDDVARYVRDRDDDALRAPGWPDDEFRADGLLDPAALISSMDRDHRRDQDRDH